MNGGHDPWDLPDLAAAAQQLRHSLKESGTFGQFFLKHLLLSFLTHPNVYFCLDTKVGRQNVEQMFLLKSFFEKSMFRAPFSRQGEQFLIRASR